MKTKTRLQAALGMALIGMLASSAFAQIRQPGRSAPTLAEPDLVVRDASGRALRSCDAGKPVAGVTVTLRNGGPSVLKTPTGATLLVVAETRGGSAPRGARLARLRYVHDNWVELEPGQSRTFSLGITFPGDPAALGGTSHRLKIDANPDRAFQEASYGNNTAYVQVSFPNGYCQKVKTVPRGVPRP